MKRNGERCHHQNVLKRKSNSVKKARYPLFVCEVVAENRVFPILSLIPLQTRYYP